MTKTRLGDIARFRRGASPRPIADPRWFSDTGPGWVRIADVTRSGKYLTNTEQCLSEEGVSRSVRVKQGDVLISVAASVGVTAIVQMDACIHDGWVAVSDYESHCDREFLYYLLNNEAPRISAIGQAGTQANINAEILRNWAVAVPTLATQRCIASILRLTDELLTKVENLITAKRAFKRALMNDLLTGRRRFPEFVSQRWDTMPLGDLFSERAETGFDELPLLAVTAERGIIPRDEVGRKDTSNADKSKYKRVKPRDIAYNTMRMWQGVSALSELEGIVSPAYTVIAPSGPMLSTYAKHLFKLPRVIHQFLRRSQGLVDDTLNLKYPSFARVKVSFPPSVKEQEAIVVVLDHVDQEIGLLERYGMELTALKRGLMQRLLSGEIEIPEDLVAAATTDGKNDDS